MMRRLGWLLCAQLGASDAYAPLFDVFGQPVAEDKKRTGAQIVKTKTALLVWGANAAAERAWQTGRSGCARVACKFSNSDAITSRVRARETAVLFTRPTCMPVTWLLLCCPALRGQRCA